MDTGQHSDSRCFSSRRRGFHCLGDYQVEQTVQHRHFQVASRHFVHGHDVKSHKLRAFLRQVIQRPVFDVRIGDIDYDMVNSSLIRNASRSTYARYACAGKLLVRNSHLLLLLTDFSKRYPGHIFLGVTHLADATLHGTDEDTFVYLIKTADIFVKTKNKNSSFHALLSKSTEATFSVSCEV